MRDATSIAEIRAASRIWAVGAVHGESGRLKALHERLEPRIAARDALVYLGNYLGHGSDVAGTVEELLAFRRRVLAHPPLRVAADIVHLRGSQEEMWQKLLQLQFASDPRAILNWVLSRGVEATLLAYGGDPDAGSRAAAGGTMSLNEWTRALREAVRKHAGHDAFFAGLKRAAVSTGNSGLLFVNCGIDTERPLAAQSDAFWWAGRSFKDIAGPYENYHRVVRGYDPDHGGFAETAHSATVDGGCGFGGTLTAACFDAAGDIVDRVEV
jgi:serine/threonine protein phosphatase 1